MKIRFRDLLYSEVSIVIYLALVILTPVWKISGIPAVRLDDLWLLLISCALLFRGGRAIIASELIIPFVCVAIVTVASVLSFVFAGYMTSSFSVISPARLLFVVYVVSQMKFTVEGLRLLGYAVIIAGILNVGAAIIYYYHIAPFDLALLKLYTSEAGFYKYANPILQAGHLTRAGGTMANPNYLGALFALAALFCSEKIMTGRFVVKFLVSCVLAVFIYSIVFYLQSRTGLLVALFGVASYMCIYLLRRGVVFGYVLLLLIVVGIVAAFGVALSFPELMPKRVAAVFQVESISDIFYEQSFLGSRVDTWVYQVQLIMSESKTIMLGYMPYGFNKISDNNYVNMFYRTGVLGLSAYLFLQLYLLKGLLQKVTSRQVGGTRVLSYRVLMFVFLFICMMVDVTADTFFSAKWSVVTLTLLFVGLCNIEVRVGPKRTLKDR